MQGEGNKPTSREIRHKIEELTELASQLLSVDKTLTGIYDMTRESIEASTVMWEYKGHDNVIQGPFTSLQISEWKRAGYLTGSTAVMMRKINPEVMEKRKLDAERWEERNENEKKRARIEITEPQKKSMAQELADDLNDDDEDSDDGLTIAEIMAKDRAKKTKATQQQQQRQQREDISVVSSSSSSSSSSSNDGGGVIEEPVGVWVSSDDIDFGHFIELADVDDDYADDEGEL